MNLIQVYEQIKQIKMQMLVLLCCVIMPLHATHYNNQTGRTIKITNVTEQKRKGEYKHRSWWNWNYRKYQKTDYRTKIEVQPQDDEATQKNQKSSVKNKKQNKQQEKASTGNKQSSKNKDKKQKEKYQPVPRYQEEKEDDQNKVIKNDYTLVLPDGMEGDLDNKQGDEITITSFGMSDKRKLFPTNNSFNYVITLNKYHKKFEKFDINHAG